MKNNHTNEAIDIAMLPLADGRRLMLPLAVLAEVKQLPRASNEATEHGELHWRGYDLPITSLDEEFGLDAPPVQHQRIVGIFRADCDSDTPFRALAFCGTAAHGRIAAGQLKDARTPAEGKFSAAAELDGQLYLVPDLPGLMYNQA